MRFHSSFAFFVALLLIFARVAQSETIVTCNFEDSFCGFNENDKFFRFTGPSPSKTSGPLADKTTGNGYYALCYGSLLLNENDTCVLSQYLSLEKSKKFTYWYFMYGSQIGTLELRVNKSVIWSMEGSQDDEWLFAQVELPKGEFLLDFVGTRSPRGRLSSDIALDDFIIEGETPINVDSRYLSDCNFDADTCDWHSDFSFYKWSHVHAIFENDTKNYGPDSDYTSISEPLLMNDTQNGSSCAIPYCLNEPTPKLYYYCKKPLLFPIDRKPYCGTRATDNSCSALSTNQDIGVCKIGRFMIVTSDLFNGTLNSMRAYLYSPSFKLDELSQNTFCMIFRYNIWSRGSDGFRILIQNYENKTDEKVYWQVRGPLPVNRWYTGAFTVQNLNMKYFRFIIEPFKGTSRDFASISIDSIEFKNKTCSDALVTTKTTRITTPRSTSTTASTIYSSFSSPVTYTLLTTTNSKSSSSITNSFLTTESLISTTIPKTSTFLDTISSISTTTLRISTTRTSIQTSLTSSTYSTTSTTTLELTNSSELTLATSPFQAHTTQTKVSSTVTYTSTIELETNEFTPTKTISSDKVTNTLSSEISKMSTTKTFDEEIPSSQKNKSNRLLYSGIFGSLGALIIISIGIFVLKKYKKMHKSNFIVQKPEEINKILNNKQENDDNSKPAINKSRKDSGIEHALTRQESKKKIKFILDDNK